MERSKRDDVSSFAIGEGKGFWPRKGAGGSEENFDRGELFTAPKTRRIGRQR